MLINSLSITDKDGLPFSGIVLNKPIEWDEKLHYFWLKIGDQLLEVPYGGYELGYCGFTVKAKCVDGTSSTFR